MIILEVFFCPKIERKWGNFQVFKNGSSCIPFKRQFYAYQRLFKTFDVRVNI